MFFYKIVSKDRKGTGAGILITYNVDIKKKTRLEHNNVFFTSADY